MLGAGFFSSSEVPMLVVATPGDALVDYQANAAPLLDKAPDVTLVTLADGSHSGFSGLSRYTRWLDNPDSLVCRYVKNLLEQQALPQSWERLLGESKDGINAVEAIRPCAGELSTAINPVLQQSMTILAVSQFLQQHFARTALEVASAKHFLYEVMPKEFSGVTVEKSSKQG